MHKYEVILYWSVADECFIAEAPELSGCKADGKNQLEALSNLNTVIDEWLETAAMMGRKAPDPAGRLMYA